MLYSFRHLVARCCKKLDGVTEWRNVLNNAAISWDEMLRAFGRPFIRILVLISINIFGKLLKLVYGPS